MQNFKYKKVAVLGAGVMGAQIATHCVNASIPALLFDLPGDEKDKNSIVKKSLAVLKKLKPAPASQADNLSYITPKNYEQDLEALADCDLIIEAIAEKFEYKKDLYEKIAKHIKPTAVVASNTSGLSINALAEFLPKSLQKQFLGVHFFNPPRYMALVELIPSEQTAPEVVDSLEGFLTSKLGKSVVRAKDTPNFVANRMGVFSMLLVLKHTADYNLPLEVVDALTGPAIGRPKSATYRTADVVGLDTFAHVVNTMVEGLKDDPWHKHFALPEWLSQLISMGALGQKTRQGIYKKVGKEIHVFDLKQQDYRPSTGKASDEVMKILAIKDPKEKLAKLRATNHPEAQFLWATFRDLFHYCAYHCESIADTVRDVDLALRWGFGWKQGPFETWQSADWQEVAKWIEEDVKDERALASVSLPAWVTADNRAGVYEKAGAFSPKAASLKPRSDLAVYKRQPYPDAVLGESFDEGKTIFETDAVRLWSQGDDTAILSFKSKMCTIGNDVLDGMVKAVEYAEDNSDGLVIWQRYSDHFSAGANLKEFVDVIMKKDYGKLNDTLNTFQQACLRMRYATVPTVAASRGYVFGGGCELMMQCSRTVAALETYIGLVEVGVGLLPAGGGCKEMAQRAAALADDPYTHLEDYFKGIAMATVAGSADEARNLGYLKADDVVVMHPLELLHVAKHQVTALAESGYVPPLKPRVKVAGRQGVARIKTLLVNMLEGQMISEHDFLIAESIANVMCGGDVDANSVVDEDWLLRLEREEFVKLAQTQNTLARIEHMLKTGKPLRN